MAGSNNFTASMKDWKIKTEKAIELVVKASAQDISNEMVLSVNEGGRMRVDTGFLRNSLVGSTDAMPRIDPGANPSDDAEKNSYPNPDVSMVILGADISRPIYLGFTAAYAVHREYGHNGVPPDAFVRMASLKWAKIVDANARKLGVK